MLKTARASLIIVAVVVVAIVASFVVIGNVARPEAATNPVFLPVLISGALVDSVNPCALSVLILTIVFLASLGAARAKVLSIGGTYIAGIFVVYFLIGVGLLRALDLFGVPHILAKIGALILLLFGTAFILSYLFPSFPIKFKIPESAHGRLAKLISQASLPAAFFLGVFVAIFEFPCTGGPYLMVLGLLHDKTTVGVGPVYLRLPDLENRLHNSRW
jgi:cytochrome c biogenesis protein CcdA